MSLQTNVNPPAPTTTTTTTTTATTNSPPPFEISFLRAMQLLHMPGEKATEQIKMMLDECLLQKKANSAFVAPAKPPVDRHPTRPLSSTNSSSTSSSRTTSLASKSSSSSMSTSVIKPMMPLSPPSEDSRNNSSCVVCKEANQESANALVECQECRNLYHQDCHEPMIKEDIRDPRFVWYCSTCTNKRKRAKFTNTNKPTVILLPTVPVRSVKDKDGANGSSSSSLAQNPEISPFKSWQFGRRG